MISKEKIETIVNKLKEIANPVAIILFGSYARGDMNEDSDLDIMVIKDKIDDKHKEMVDLRRAVRKERVPLDIVPIEFDFFTKWKDVKGTIYYKADKEGIRL